jgi:DNA-binding SARP family transcriptional activator
MGSTADQIVIGEKVSKPTINALPRPRITDRFAELLTSGVGYVHGAAGIGKTTALCQLVDEWTGVVGWIRLDHGDADESRLVALLGSALQLPDRGADSTIDHVIAQLESPERTPTLLVFDDLHSIEGSEAERAIHRLLRYRPSHVAVLMGSRHDLGIGLRGIVGSAEPMLIDYEDLRFRVWEVDDLMRAHHDLPLAPVDLHALCRYTDGWAAALRLFWVASRGAAPEHRSQLISGLRTTSGMVHDYLMSEVLSSLPAGAREFLVATAVFEQITPERADELLGMKNSRGILSSIQAVGLFGDVPETADTFRCHDLLRTHLLSQLAEQVGDEEAGSLQLRAAMLVEAEGSPAEAIRYYARGGDFDSVRRILDTRGDEWSIGPGQWIELLPSAMRDQDPFVLLTSARQLVRHGDLAEARNRYRRAVDLLESDDGASRTARRELRLVDAWIGGETAPVPGWIGDVRDMLRVGAAAQRGGAEREGFGRAVADLLTGELATASSSFRRAEEAESGLTGVVAGTARLLVDHLRFGDSGCSPVALRRVQQAAKRLDARAVERLIGAISRGGVNAGVDDSLSAECRRSNDCLGGGLVHLVDGVALIHEGRSDREPFVLAAEMFAEGGYGELALLSRCFDAAARAVAGGDVADQLSLESEARRSGGISRLLMLVARAEARASGDASLEHQIEHMSQRFDASVLIARLRLPVSADSDEGTQPGAVVQVLGSFRVTAVDPVMVSELTPLHQEVFAFLAVHAGEWVPKDRLMTAFWPEKDDTRARRSLQVAISRVRLEVERLGVGTLERDGSRYSLAPAATTIVDILSLRDELAVPADPLSARVDAIEKAMSAYGELVEDLGALSWATETRRELRLSVSRAAHQAAVALTDAGDLSRAARVAEAGVRIDPGSDDLWQIAIANAGVARAGELRLEYDRVVASYELAQGGS